MNIEIEEIPTSVDLKKNFRSRFQSAYSYAASFPPAVPGTAINMYTEPGDVVLDPFAGKGTTPLQALLMDRNAFANDLSTVGYTYTRSRVMTPSIDEARDRIIELSKKIENVKIDLGKYARLSAMFHPDTLNELFAIRHYILNSDTRVDYFLRAMICSGLFGSGNKYFSGDFSMPGGFPPNLTTLIRSSQKRHELPKYKDAIKVLMTRVDYYTEDGYPYPKSGTVYNDNAERIHEHMKDARADFVVTSPPYIDLMKYGEKNWVQYLYLGESYKDYDTTTTSKIGSTSGNRKEYYTSMLLTLKSVYKVLKDDSAAIFVVGGSKDDKDIMAVPKAFAKLGEEVGFTVDAIYSRQFQSQFRTMLDQDVREKKGTDYKDAWIIFHKGNPERYMSIEKANRNETTKEVSLDEVDFNLG